MLVILDIDGVMVRANSWTAPELLEDGFYKFEIKAINTLNILNPNILLSSSHRNRYSISEWKEIFNRRNIIFKDFNILPSNSNKKEEIIKYINENELNEYIIIDDDKTFNSLPFKNKFIQTDPSIGLIKNNISFLLNNI